MKITYRGDYALKALFQLALRYEGDAGSVMPITEIARHGDMPVKFLEQILLALRRGGFVKSRRGVKGGFFLARPPAEITVGQIVRFIEGPIEPIECIGKETYRGCKDIACCIFRDIWKEVRNAISGIVDTLTLADLVARHKDRNLKARSVREYSI